MEDNTPSWIDEALEPVERSSPAGSWTEYGGERWRVLVGDWTTTPLLPELLAVKHSACDELHRVHIIADPPYGKSTHNNVMRGAKKNSAAKKQALTFPPVDPAAIVPLAMDVATGWIVLFGELEALGDYKRAALDVHKKGWKRAGVARRTTPQPQISGDRPGQGADGIAIMHAPHKGHARWNGGGKAGVWSLDTERAGDRFHETQKPLNIMIQLVEDFTEPGDVVVDPYGGAMTTGVACLLTGRKFVGVDLQEKYARRGAIRLVAESRGLTLGDFENGQRSVWELLEGAR